MKRRAFLASLMATALGSSVTCAEQPSNKIPRVGILTLAENDATPSWEAFRQGLRELGYIEGYNITSTSRFRSCATSSIRTELGVAVSRRYRGAVTALSRR
jgi:hypothetical protein